MQLKLLKPGLADVYGLPREDTSEETILAMLKARGMTDAEAKYHLNCAVIAGLYQLIDDAPKRTIEDTSKRMIDDAPKQTRRAREEK